MSDLIILGKGPTAVFADDYLKAVKGAELWTLNEVVHPAAALHFDIHEDRRFWQSYDDISCGWCVSPFAPVTAMKPRMARFPLLECFQAFGSAYFECSIDYMLALALLRKLRGQKAWKRIWLPGCDMADGRHFGFRAGTHFWLGLARGLGVELKIPGPSMLLKRIVTMPPCAHGDPEFPHAYGQLPESTAPLAVKYGW